MTEWQILFLVPIVVVTCLLLHLIGLRLKEVTVYYGESSHSFFTALLQLILKWKIIGVLSDYSKVVETYLAHLKCRQSDKSQSTSETDTYLYLLDKEFGIEAKSREQEELSPETWFAHPKIYRFLGLIVICWLLYRGKDVLIYLFF